MRATKLQHATSAAIYAKKVTVPEIPSIPYARLLQVLGQDGYTACILVSLSCLFL